ncbi:hybrid sensor histidine kinase/response regulator [Thiocystis violacea]|uniref:hybrid sensor histidine kinase/response regulator n=1 Tax=Thiocystis violacea TaxID=13725 RepID=UPI00190572DC|nr:hybrid sensor histidine kinase/response regulator [Thiocystis violacea]MBK1716421.1 hypothetical protein [Thiocystis violacea]
MNPGAMAEVFVAAAPALQEAVELAGESSASSEDRLAAANDFAEILADIWSRLEPLGPHLAELLGLMEMAVSGLPDLAEDSDGEAMALVLELLALLEAHFEAPDDEEVIEALLDLATSESFDPPLSDESASRWRAPAEPRTEPEPEAAEPLERVAAERGGVEPPRGASLASAVAAHQVIEEPDETELGDAAAELYALLAYAVEDSREELLRRIRAIAGASDGEARAGAARACRDILARFAGAAAEAGFVSLATLCASLGYQFAAMPPEVAWPDSMLEDLERLPRCLLEYLEAPLVASTRIELVETLLDPRWPNPLSPVNAEELILELYRDPLLVESEERPSRAREIEPEDLDLRPAEEIDAAILASFRREGPDLALGLATVLQRIIAGAGGEAALREAQRFAHTLKGSANVCGVRAIAVLSHHLEDLLEFLTEQGVAPSAALGETLTAGADGLAIMFDVLEGVEPWDPEALRPIMLEVLDWANRIDREGLAALGDEASAPRSTVASDSAEAAPEAAPDEDEAYIQVPARVIDDLLRQVGELTMTLSQSEERLRQAQRTLRESGEIEQRNFLYVAELEKLVDLRGLGSQGVGGGSSSPESVFDPLELEQYNEMYIATRHLNEGVSDARELARTLGETLGDLDELSRQQIKLSQRMRQLTMATRLVPVASVVARLQRVTRQTCRATGKEVELIVHGGETRIDGEVMDRLMPVLLHVIRNAIDHGIELGDQREIAGKPRQGRLDIGFGHLGDRIQLVIGDDGRGLDLARVRAKAIDIGLIDADAELSDQEAALLTLRPGFSTRGQVTQVSGRGVGMDVVASTVRALGGSLAIDSEPGKGYRLTVRLPASLLTLYCLLVRCDEQLLAIPANEVRLAVVSDEGEIQETGDGWTFRHAEGTFALSHLNSLMGVPARDPRQGRQVVLLVDSEIGERAIMVEALLEGRELVIMKLGALIPRVPGLMSASILGDGRVVPIIEPRGLSRVVAGADSSDRLAQQATERARPPTVLVVDDSLSMRRILSRLVEDSGYRPLAARDGLEAIRILARDPVDALLVDMEMPQMNGLELTAHLRSQPATSALPIAMITSRSTEKHRREAVRAGVDAYFVKPYRDEEVLDFLQQAVEPASQ